MPKALITGITGQDGSYLAELLLSKSYEVHGLVRRTSSLERSRLHHLYSNPDIYGCSLFLHYCDLEDVTTLRRILKRTTPDELYHLAGQSHVGLSFEIAESTVDSVALATLRLLEILRDIDQPPRLFHASSSEIFGTPLIMPQDEHTPFAPMNPYGAAKAFATQLVRIYRQKFGLYLSNGILYNHESPRRGENFVTRKICQAAAAIKLGLQSELVLGDIEAQRDWGNATDFVRGMWLALQQKKADDYLFATGELHKVRDILDIAFIAMGLEWQKYVKQDQRFMRPTEPQRLLGNPSKAECELGWKRECTFKQTIHQMAEAEFALLNAKGILD